MALLLPAVQSAREAARRAKCANNVKQLVLAVNNFEAAHGHYPRSICGFESTSPQPDPATFTCLSPAGQVAP